MPHYFFDTDDGKFHHTDEEGFEVPNIEAARVKAPAALPDMVRNQRLDQDRHNFSVQVRDTGGTVVYSAGLDVVGAWHVPRSVS